MVPNKRPSSKDEHHLLYTRKDWSSGSAKVLRRQSYCKVRLPRDLHEKLHAEVPSVPVPGGNSVKHALDQMDYLAHFGAISEKDNVEKRLLVLIALFDCVEQPTADALRKQLKIIREYYKTPR